MERPCRRIGTIGGTSWESTLEYYRLSNQQSAARLGGRLREDIVGCVLAPGESCSESQLAELYGVGKASVRRALAALSREGLVTARPRQGHTVAPVTLTSVNDLFG